MFDHPQHSDPERLAHEVLNLSRNTLLVNLRFLDAALSMFEPVAIDQNELLTDGKLLLFQPARVLRHYVNEKESVVRDYLHLVFHCVFRHMFMDPSLDRPTWDLATDIAVENMISELGLKATEARRQSLQQTEIQKLKGALPALTAERIYRYYLDRNLPPVELAKLRGLFYTDNHEIWYMTQAQIAAVYGVSGGSSGEESGDDDKDGESGAGSDEGRAALAARWSEISERMEMETEGFSKLPGTQAGAFTQNLKEVNREKYDYTAFLKKYAVLGEVMKINDDEFDYVFYTYGLQRYKNMPLIEPLEYKDVKRIREFVIAIDTSGSVSGDLVQKFVQKTYNILKSTESFFAKINLHIIQCDAEIQEHVAITSQEDFDRYLETMKLHGFGGTDFRPVFSLVDKLIEEKAFNNLKGLIYFTDGYGTFPAKKPAYETAFVFLDEGFNNYNVPPWAIKLILRKEEI